MPRARSTGWLGRFCRHSRPDRRGPQSPRPRAVRRVGEDGRGRGCRSAPWSARRSRQPEARRGRVRWHHPHRLHPRLLQHRGERHHRLGRDRSHGRHVRRIGPPVHRLVRNGHDARPPRDGRRCDGRFGCVHQSPQVGRGGAVDGGSWHARDGGAAPAVDAARVYRLALEKGTSGARFHAVAEEGIPIRDIAEAIGRRLNVPAVSKTPEEAAALLGMIGRVLAMDLPASSALTQHRLGWRPTGPGLIADLDEGHYFDT